MHWEKFTIKKINREMNSPVTVCHHQSATQTRASAGWRRPLPDLQGTWYSIQEQSLNSKSCADGYQILDKNDRAIRAWSRWSWDRQEVLTIQDSPDVLYCVLYKYLYSASYGKSQTEALSVHFSSRKKVRLKTRVKQGRGVERIDEQRGEGRQFQSDRNRWKGPG